MRVGPRSGCRVGGEGFGFDCLFRSPPAPGAVRVVYVELYRVISGYLSCLVVDWMDRAKYDTASVGKRREWIGPLGVGLITGRTSGESLCTGQRREVCLRCNITLTSGNVLWILCSLVLRSVTKNNEI